MRKVLAILAVLAAFPAQAQVLQSGTVTAGHVMVWAGNGLAKDGGTAANGFITSLGITNNGGPGMCVASAQPSTAVGYNQLCLSASTAAAAQITLQNYGTATAQNLEFDINGTVITLPTGGGTTLPTITIPLVTGNIICASGTTGSLVSCTTGTNGQLFIGQTGGIPLWKTIDGDITSIDALGNVVVGKVNGVTYPASPSVGTAPYVSSANTITYGTIPATAGGTGAISPTAHGVLIAQGAGAMTTANSASIGLCLLSQGAGSDPAFGSCSSGAGSAGGSNTQVQFNNASALAGSANLTWVSPALSIGQNAVATGQIVLSNGNALGNAATVQNIAATSAYNFNLPAAAGTAGQPLLSGGGGASPMTFGTLGVSAGGTNCTSASGTCIDNISAWSGTGFINRTGAGTYSFTSTIGLINGGTGANLTASNGGIVYSTASAMAILSGTATANQVLLSGSSTTPAWSTATYPATTTANQLLYSSALNTIAGLATANNGVLITSGAGAPSISSTLPSAVQGNITTVGTIATGVWNGTAIDLAHGGTNANLTASNGGIFYSTATAGAILVGTATANQPLLSGASTTPSWAAVSYPTSATSGGIPYFSTSTAMSSSAALGAGQVVLGGGAGAAPTTSANASITSGTLTLGQIGSVGGAIVLNGSTSGSATVQVAAAAGTGTIFQLPASNGTNGYVLTTNGSGVTSWSNPTTGGTVTSIATGACLTGGTITTTGTISSICSPAPQGRVTLSSGTPVMISTVTGATTVYYTPAVGNLVPIYDGTNLVPTSFAEVSQATTDATKSPAAVTANSNYDIFCWVDTGTNRCTRGPAWTSSTARGTGAGTTELVRVNGVLLNANSITNGPAAQRGTYVGTIRSNGTSSIDFIYGAAASGGTAASFGVWNMYNRVIITATVTDNGTSYTYTSATVRQARGSTGNQVSFVSGLQEDAVVAQYSGEVVTAATTNASALFGIGFDTTTAFSSKRMAAFAPSALSYLNVSTAVYNTTTLGWHVISANEGSDGTNANTFDNGAGNQLSFQFRM